MADNIVHTTDNNPALKDQQVTSPRSESSSKPASSTLNALGPVVSESYPSDKHFAEHASNPATPGDLFPGAFPKAKDNQPSSFNQDADYVKEAASNALETAKDYVYSAGEVVGGYLPKSVAAYFPNNGSPKQSRESLQYNTRVAQNNSIASESNSETLPGPGPHGETLEDAHIPEDAGITGTRVIEDHSLVAQTPTKAKSSASDTAGPTKPEDNTLVPPSIGTIGDSHDDSNDVRGGDVSTSPKQPDGASTDASTRTLTGSHVDTWGHVTTAANSTHESHKADMLNTDGTMKTSSSAADNLQHDFSAVQEKEHKDPDNNADRPEFEHHPEETRHINAPPVSESTDKSAAPHVTSPVTAGREHLTAIEKSTKSRSDSKPFSHQDSLRSTVATPGHDGHGQASERGKEREPFGDVAATTHTAAAAPEPAETGAWAGSVVTGIDTSASRPTINNAPTEDAGAWAANIVSGLDTPAVDRTAAATTTTTTNNNNNANNFAGATYPTAPSAGAAKVNTIGTDGTTPIITKDLPDTPAGDHHDGAVSSASAANSNSNSNSKAKNNGSPTKPKFMDKLRGEMKIISGKLEHSHEKIEEGRRLMGKSSLKN